MDGKGFTAATWPTVQVFQDTVAGPQDVDGGAAVFALGDTINGRTMRRFSLPQPVIWWDDEDEIGALAIQAEQHETDEGDTLEVLGLLLPDGSTAVAMLEDLEIVDGFDPEWINLIQAESTTVDGEDDDDNGEEPLLHERFDDA